MSVIDTKVFTGFGERFREVWGLTDKDLGCVPTAGGQAVIDVTQDAIDRALIAIHLDQYEALLALLEAAKEWLAAFPIYEGCDCEQCNKRRQIHTAVRAVVDLSKQRYPAL